MSEKTEIERGSAETFIRLYNLETNSAFSIERYGDAPDVLCRDNSGEELKLEITLTEDRPGDIRALMGRSEDRNLESLRRHLAEVRAGRADPRDRASCLNRNVLDMICDRIRAKLTKDYGRNAALLVRDSSGVDWDWDLILDDVRSKLNLSRNPFEKGIWILSRDGNRLFRLV